MSLGENIKKIRKAKKMTQKELADSIGVKTITIRKYESDEREPKMDVLKKIATALEVDISHLISSSNFNLVNAESLMKKSVDDLMELLIAVNVYTNHNTMFDYYGHTEEFTVRFFKGGWGRHMDPTETFRIYLDQEGWEDEINRLYNHYYEILNKDHITGYDEECGF